MELSDKGLDLIRDAEDFREFAYPDPGSPLARASLGRPWGFESAINILEAHPELRGLDGTPWTCGYGHTGGLSAHDACSEEEAERWLKHDSENAVDAVNKLTLPLNQNQFDALVSAVFNLGPGILQANRSLGGALHDHDYEGAANALLLYHNAGGKFSQGLMNRREKERELFLTPEGK